MDLKALWASWRSNDAHFPAKALQPILTLWLALMIAAPLAQALFVTVRPPFNAPAAMADYMNAQVSQDALVETWEPEMGFLTDHRYHFPPQLLLDTAVGYIWRGGAPPADSYDFTQPAPPDYVLVGEFSRWVNLYPPEKLEQLYTPVFSTGAYELYQLKAAP